MGRSAVDEPGTRFELTERQDEVLRLMAKGLTNAQIGDALGISLDGAKWHVSEIIGKLGVRNREEAVAAWREYRRPGARLGRAFRGMVGLSVVRWAAVGVAGLAVAGGVVAAVVVARDGGGEAEAIEPGGSPTLVIGDSVPLPDDVLVYYRGGALAGPSVLYARRTDEGEIVHEPAFGTLQPEDGVVAQYGHNHAAGTAYALVCRVNPCGRHLHAGPELASTGRPELYLLTSDDGGVTWEREWEMPLGDFGLDEFFPAIYDEELMVRTLDYEDGEIVERYRLYPSDTEYVPRGSAPDPLPGGQRLMSERHADPDGEGFFGQWAGPGESVHYIGRFDAGGELVKSWAFPHGDEPGPPSLRLLAATGEGTLAATIRTPSDQFGTRAELVIIDLANSTMHPVNDLGVGNAALTLEILPGVFRPVTAGAGCAPVVADPAAATGQRCFADGVLLKDLGETREVDSESWLRVADPAGVEGWVRTGDVE